MPALSTEPILAITVRPPWSHWLASGVKTVENRTWRPPGGWRGQLVIHAGMTMDWPAFAVGARLGHYVDEDYVARGEYLAVAELLEVHQAGPDCSASCTPWGEPRCFHWMLGPIRRLVSVEGRGRQKLFLPPPDVIEQVIAG